MSTAKEEVEALLKKFPDDCRLADIQNHLYVIEKIHRGLERAEDGEEIFLKTIIPSRKATEIYFGRKRK